MPVVRNTFHAATPIGEALQGLSNSYFSGPTGLERQNARMSAEYKRALTNKANYEVMADQRDYGHRQGYAENPTSIADAILSGAKGRDASRFSLMATAQNPDATPDALIRARLADGSATGVNDAVTHGHQSQIRADNAANQMAESQVVQALKNSGMLGVANANNAHDMAMMRQFPTENVARGAAFTALPPEQQAIAVGPVANEVKGHFASQLQDPADQRRFAMGNPSAPVKIVDPNSISGMSYYGQEHEAHGLPAPAPAAAKSSDVLDQGTMSELNMRTESIANSKSLVARARELGSNPQNFGAVGWMKGTLQDAVQQGDAMAAAFGQRGSEIQKEIMAKGHDISPAFFDPTLPQRDYITRVLAYNLAGTIADQKGRGLSDRDLQTWMANLDAAGPLNNQANYMARLDLTDQMLDDMAAQTASTIQRYGGQGGQEQPAGEPDLRSMSTEELIRLRDSQ